MGSYAKKDCATSSSGIHPRSRSTRVWSSNEALSSQQVRSSSCGSSVGGRITRPNASGVGAAVAS
eukprot:scaffold2988_cov123-Isochrysis_galbana.AAC.13